MIARAAAAALIAALAAPRAGRAQSAYDGLEPVAGDDHQHSGSLLNHYVLQRVIDGVQSTCPHAWGAATDLFDLHRSKGYDFALLSHHDACQPADVDGDGWPDVADNCPAAYNGNQQDGDADGYGHPCDNCPAQTNPDQRDTDGDARGDVCDDDDDGDGLSDADESAHGTDPLDPDSDDDGFLDGDEIAAGTDPNDPSSKPVTIPIGGWVAPALAVALVAGGVAARRRCAGSR